MKFFFFSLFLALLLVSPHLCAHREAGAECDETAQPNIKDFNAFHGLSNSQFEDYSRLSGQGGKSCKGLLWVNVTQKNWDQNFHAVHITSSCKDVVCRCLHCGSGDLKNQAFSGYVDSETGLCHVPWVVDQSVKEYQILTNPCGMRLDWVKPKDPKTAPVPPCSVVGGYEATAAQYVARGLPPYGDRASLSYVGRTTGPDGKLYGGKVHAVDKWFYYPYQGKQADTNANYEVLVFKY